MADRPTDDEDSLYFVPDSPKTCQYRHEHRYMDEAIMIVCDELAEVVWNDEHGIESLRCSKHYPHIIKVLEDKK